MQPLRSERMRGLWRPVDAVAGGELRWATNSKYGPTILALVLALVALPFVALSLQVYTLTPGKSSADRLVDTWAVGRWTAAASAVIVSALVAGSFGGWLHRNNRFGGGHLLTGILAWVVALQAVTYGPVITGQSVSIEQFCMDGCQPGLNGINPVAAGLTALFTPIIAFVEPVSFWALVIGVVIWSGILNHYAPLPKTRSTWPPATWPPPNLAPGTFWQPAPAAPPGPWPWDGAMTRLFTRSAAPLILALAFAAVSLLIVAQNLSVYDPVRGPSPVAGLPDFPGEFVPLPAAAAGRWLAAAGGVFAAAIVGGGFGIWARRRLPRVFEVPTFVVAWVTGVAATPLLPRIFGVGVGIEAIPADFPNGPAWPGVLAVNPGNNFEWLRLVAASPIGARYEPVAFGALFVGVLLWGRAIRRYGRVEAQAGAAETPDGPPVDRTGPGFE